MFDNPNKCQTNSRSPKCLGPCIFSTLFLLHANSISSETVEVFEWVFNIKANDYGRSDGK